MEGRTILVTVPDDDTAERTIRYAAKQLSEGHELIVLDYIPVIPRKAMPGIVAKLVAYVKIQEARWSAFTEEALEGEGGR